MYFVEESAEEEYNSLCGYLVGSLNDADIYKF